MFQEHGYMATGDIEADDSLRVPSSVNMHIYVVYIASHVVMFIKLDVICLTKGPIIWTLLPQ
jgi:hypothetical protein